MEKALENLKTDLTGSYERAPSTVSTNMIRSRQFLRWLDHPPPPTRMELQRYFAHRRQKGDTGRTLSTTFFALRNLYQANEWEWPLTKKDQPRFKKRATTPAFFEDEVLAIIRNRDKYSDDERFYLAMATIYALRREEMSRLHRRGIRDGTILIHHAKGGEDRRVLIPEEIRRVVTAWRHKPLTVAALSLMFRRIMVKSGLGKRKGWGWNCFRTTLDTLMPTYLANARHPASRWGEFVGWAPETVGSEYLGARMAGVYSRPEILDKDGHGLDRIIFSVHPFLKAWTESV